MISPDYRYEVQSPDGRGNWYREYASSDRADAVAEMRDGWRVYDWRANAVVDGVGAPPPVPPGAADPAGPQQSDYAAVSTADLVVLYRALRAVPGTAVSPMQSGAVLARVRAELGRRTQPDTDAVVEALAAALRTDAPKETT